MKRRIIAVMLISSMVLSFAGCKKKEKTESSSEETTTSSEAAVSESETEPSASETVTEPEEFAFNQTNIPGIQFCYSTNPMAVSAFSVLLGVSRQEAQELLDQRHYDIRYTPDQSGIALLPETALDADVEKETVAYDALVFIVNKDNPVSSISQKDLQKIYLGEITNWKELGGNDQKIVAFEEGRYDTARKIFDSMLPGGESKVDSPYIIVPGDDYAVCTARCSYDNSENAIGYLQYSSLIGSHMEKEVKILKIDGVEPSKEMIRSGEYPFCIPLDVAIAKFLPSGDLAWTLYQWLTGSDGRKLAEMAGYVVPDTAPSGKTDLPVSVNWSAFQEVKKEDEVFTRLKEEKITEFAPSSDYGAVIPFLGVDNELHWCEGQKLYGLMDQSGRIICDPVFDDAYYLEDGSLCVVQYVINSESDLPDTRIGLISKDGSYYTGLVYDGRTISGGGFYTIEKNGITLYKYDPSTGKVGSGKLLKMGDVRKMYCFEGIVNDRYVECFDYFDDYSWIYDGTTGKDILPSIKSRYDDWSIYGNFILGHEVNASGKETKKIYSFDGKALSDDCYLSAIDLYIDQYTILARTESKDDNTTNDTDHYDYFDLVDKYGKVITSIENKGHSVSEIHCMNETLIVIYPKSVELYDFAGNLLKTVELDWPETLYTPSYPMGDGNVELKPEKEPLILYTSYFKTNLYNLESGASAEFSQQYYVEVVGDNILLTSGTDENTGWKLLKCSDFSLIAEGEGYIAATKDYADGKFYLINNFGEGRYPSEIHILDAKTGDPVLEKKADQGRGFISVERIYAGKVVFHTMQAADTSFVCDAVTVTDLSGKVVMHYNTFAVPYT